MERSQKHRLASGGLLTGAMLDALCDMHYAQKAGKHEDAEIVCDGAQCWLSHRRVGKQTVNRLLRLMLVGFSDAGGAEHYALNDTGIAVLGRPALAEEIRVAILAGRLFTVVDGRIQEI